MSERPKHPIFLERAGYRQRRLRDAARLLPVLGVVLWAIPLLWSSESAEAPSSATAVLYVFGIWVFLIALTAQVSRGLRQENNGEKGDSAD